MRRLNFLPMIILCLIFFCSCGETQNTNPGEQVRELYSDTDKCTMQAEVTADYGNRVYEYKLKYAFDRNGQSIVEIVEPELLAGIRATIESGDTALDTGEVSLETGPLGQTGLTPVEVMPVLLRTFSEGYLVETGGEKIDGIKYHLLTYKSYFGESVVEYRVWFDSETLKPYRAQIFEDNYAIIKCEIEAFEFI